MIGRLQRASILPTWKGALSLAAAGLCGAIAHRLGVPLAWVLGPLIATATIAIAGAPVFASLAWRRAGQVVIGTSIGLNVTAALLAVIMLWLPIMVVTALIAILIAAALSVTYARLARVDDKTAYYAMMPGGLSEMANLGAAAGARAEPIAVAQALRVAVLVTILPPLIVGLDIQGAESLSPSYPDLSLIVTGTALAGGVAGVGLARLARLNNPWMIGAIVGAGALTATGLVLGRLPTPLYWLGQFLIGISIGARFRREIILRLPRLCITSIAFVLALAALLAGYAGLLSLISGLDLASAVLGASAGGMAEMAITAQTLHLSVGLVTAFHVVRALIVNAFAPQLWSLLDRLGLFAALRRSTPI